MAPSQVVLKLAGQLPDRGITRDSRITKLLLLPGHFGFELGVLRFKLAQAADISTIGGADEVRQHVPSEKIERTNASSVAGCVSAAQ
jgi:hypothetical protein